MVFSSPIFIFLFFPVCLLFYLLASFCKNTKVSNICLLIFSIIFYAYGSIDFLPILLISIVVNFFLSRYIDSNIEKRKTFFIIAICINLLLLFIFKYLNLFSGVFTAGKYKTNINLPIGISFYTFQVLSYIIDVYRKKIKASDNIIDFALFTMLFPQLIAGPIVRYSSIETELKNRKVTFDGFSDGIKRFMIGFAKKLIFANVLGSVADAGFKIIAYSTLGPLLSLLIIVCFSIQIYLDFWAYSDMAIGIGMIFGFTFPENFNMPFSSTSITEFWSRWHITLSSFFRDYVYIPLGGNKKGLLFTCINLLIVFVLSGFWHGANFNYLLWGLYNAVFIIIERIRRNYVKIEVPKTIGIIYVFVVWIFGMAIFRCENLPDIHMFIRGMFSRESFNSYTRDLITAIFSPKFIISFVISMLYLTPIFAKIKDTLYRSKYGFIIVDIVVIALFIIAIIEMLTTGFNPFIYFRF